ncbi:MAG: hypothetical protein ACTSRP_00310 [Candidatus Helarchaeota archaeon]
MSKRKRRDQTSERHYIYPHYHCVVCNKIIEKGQNHIEKISKERGLEIVNHFCSQKCYDLVHQETKRSFWKKYLPWIIMASSVIVLIVMMVLFSQ